MTPILASGVAWSQPNRISGWIHRRAAAGTGIDTNSANIPYCICRIGRSVMFAGGERRFSPDVALAGVDRVHCEAALIDDVQGIGFYLRVPTLRYGINIIGRIVSRAGRFAFHFRIRTRGVPSCGCRTRTISGILWIGGARLTK